MDLARTVRKYMTPLVTLLLAIVIIFAAADSSAISRQLHVYKLLPRPERLTELYFSNHTALPANYSVGQSQSFSFTVHNLEYRSETYSYHVVEQADDDSTNAPSSLLASGSFQLSQNQSRTTPVTITLTDSGAKAKIAVDLLQPSQSIDYLVTKEAT